MSTTTSHTFAPPDGDLYAAVEVWAAPPDGELRKVGAQPAFRLVTVVVGQYRDETGGLVDETEQRMVPLDRVAVDCYTTPRDTRFRCYWVPEDSSRGIQQTETTAGRRRLGGA